MLLQTLSNRPASFMNYSDAVKRIDAINQKETSASIYPPSFTRLYTHGQKTRRVVLWFHGYSNSPRGFIPLAETLFNQGDNVFVPLAPFHGYQDRLTTDTGLLTAKILSEFANTSLDIALGLGDEVIVGGLSMGGVITAWLAQKRHCISRAVIISPSFGAKTIPAHLTDITTTLLLLKPDYFHWWNPGSELKDYTQPSPRFHSYPRISMHGLAQIFRLGLSARRAGLLRPPLAQEVWWILNDNDPSINNQLNKNIYKHWHRLAPDRVHQYTFPSELELGHDIVDPTSATQKIEISHPLILDVFNGNRSLQERLKR